MNDVLREGLMIVGSYVGIIVIGFALINFLSAGFLTRFIKVRGSRGKLVLVKVRGVTDHYFRTGKVTEKTLIYKARDQKELKRIAVPDQSVFYRALMVWNIDVDEESNEIISPKTGDPQNSYDAEKYDQLITRALYKPALMDKNEKILLLMIGACILGLIIVFFYVKSVDQNVYTLLEQMSKLNQVASNSVGVVS